MNVGVIVLIIGFIIMVLSSSYVSATTPGVVTGFVMVLAGLLVFVAGIIKWITQTPREEAVK